MKRFLYLDVNKSTGNNVGDDTYNTEEYREIGLWFTTY